MGSLSGGGGGRLKERGRVATFGVPTRGGGGGAREGGSARNRGDAAGPPSNLGDGRGGACMDCVGSCVPIANRRAERGGEGREVTAGCGETAISGLDGRSGSTIFCLFFRTSEVRDDSSEWERVSLGG